ncbi:IPT/TIG domain-containing protein [Butyrivibrio sp. MB2005]|uniref:IPT/TIG domain-containing protein n=1 Tax=Butyrivibrio sp. MB2005 TaxID=1280678 RepID=UPI00042109BE|nr:IPT/TIG domain-containing protein [Butyrivibrio sp. MB2005]
MSRRKRICLLVAGFLLLAYFLAYTIPTYLKSTPRITSIDPPSIADRNGLGDDNTVTITGEGLKEAIAVYVNDEWNPKNRIVEKDDKHVVVKITQKIRKTPGTYYIKVQVKVNSDIDRFSNKLPFVVGNGEE